MAFPATYNFSYYKGDTYSFLVYPKDASGAAFILTGYTAKFTIAESRGSGGVSSQIEAYSNIPSGENYIECVIRPTDGAQLDSTKDYVYDVEISKTGDTYNSVYTVLTGNVTITDQVTGAT